MSIYNTLSTVNNVTGASDWAFSSLTNTTSFPCPSYVYYQVFQGYYVQSNISSAGSPLQVSPVYKFLSCPQFIWSYYLFQPSSDQALIPNGHSETNSSIIYQKTTTGLTALLTGNYTEMYNASIFTMNGALPPPPFPPGTYTLVAGDQWGQLVILHFVVTVARSLHRPVEYDRAKCWEFDD